MKITNRQLRRFCYYAPIFCSMAVLSSQLQAGPTIQLNGDESRDGIADSGRIGYVGGNTRIGVSIDRDLQGQVDLNQIIHEDDSSATSAEGWFGYKLKDDSNNSQGVDSGGVKVNHQWANDEADTVHKVFGAYDRNADDLSKVTVGYGQETEDLFWSGHIKKGLGDEVINGDVATRTYDYGVGGEVGTFLEGTQTRIRGGLDYEFGTEYADDEDRPANLTISAGVEQFFHDTPHSISLDVSGNQKSGGADAKDTDYNARLGYRYEFGGGGAYQSDSAMSRRRVEIPGTPARPGRAGHPGRAAIHGQAAIPAQAGRPAQPAVAPKYERKLVKKPGHEFVKTTMKLENETFFKLNSSALTSSAKVNLNKIIGQVRSHGYVGGIRITGNTCGLGDPVYDQRLSENRANAVRDYLIDQGFSPSHLIARGLGKGSPKYNRKDDDFKNRRVDLEFMTERSTRKQSAQSYYKNVLVQEGRAAVAAIPARPGRPAVPGRAGIPATPAIAATPGTPSRFVWKTEVVKSAPIWIKRALRNTIKHDRSINTYTTRAAAKATNDSFTLTSRDGLFDVLGNDSTGSELIGVTQPGNGTVTIEDGQVRYTPNPGFSGTDTFTYTIQDRDGNTQEATVTVTVPTIVNNVPVAGDDTSSTDEDTAVAIPVGANDDDADGDTLTTTITTAPTNGTATETSPGVITYTPNTGFSGTDAFIYTVNDGNGNTDTATVTVNVNNVNSAPKATDDTKSTPEDTATTVTVLSNDTDPDNDTLTVAITTGPSNGTASVVNGEIVYTPTAGFVGTDTIEYSITDPDGLVDTATATITVTNVNVAPTATDDSETTPEDTAITIPVMNNDSDADGDTISIGSASTPSDGTAVISGSNIIYTPDAGFTGTDTFTYIISDPDGSTATATVIVTVTNVNVAPTATNDSRTTPEDTAITIPVMNNDSDADGDGDTISIDSASTPSDGTAVISGSDIIYTPDAGFTGTDTFTYTITDPDGSTATATVTVTVTNSNVAPIATDDSRTTPEDTAISIPVMSNDSDPDGDVISISTSTAPSDGTAVVNGVNILYTPNTGFTGTDTFTYTITDPDGSTATATVDVTVTSTNNAPKASSDSDSTPKNTPITVNVLSNDNDPDGDTLTVTIASSPGDGTVSVSGNQIIYTPDNGFSGTDSFTYTITDPDGLSDTTTVEITVIDPNNAPTPANDSRTTPEDTAITIDVLTNDTDPDGDTFTLTSNTTPISGTASISGNSIVYTPNTGFSGTDIFDYTITDSNGATQTATVTVTVEKGNVAPTLVDDTVTTPHDTAIVMDVILNDTDPDGDALTITGVSTPTAGGTVNIVGNNVNYTPASGFTGIDTYTYTVSDGNGHTVTANATVNVSAAANIPPIAVDDNASTDYETPVTINVAGNDSDPDGTTTCVSNIVTAPTNGSVNILTTGTDITYTPFNGFSGSDSFVYTACDADGATSTATVYVTVAANTNQPPNLSPNYAAIQGYFPVTIRVLADDTDPDGDTLTLTNITTPPSFGTAVISGDNVIYEANSGFVGADFFYYEVSDGNGNTATERVDIDVKNDNSAPVVAPIPAMTANLGGTTTMDIASYLSDPDGDSVYVAVADALGGSITFSGTVLQYTPNPSEVSTGDTDTIYITVSDGQGGITDAIMTVNVN